MPYIEQVQREQLWKYIDGVGTLIQTPGSPGGLNFLITSIINDYLAGGRTESYDQYNAVMGVLASVTQELYRVQIVPYEQMKKNENGGVYANQS